MDMTNSIILLNACIHRRVIPMWADTWKTLQEVYYRNNALSIVISILCTVKNCYVLMQERFLCGNWSIVCWTYPQACDLWCTILDSWPPGPKRITPSRLYWIMWAFWFVTPSLTSQLYRHHYIMYDNVISQLSILPCPLCVLFLRLWCYMFLSWCVMLESCMSSCVSHQDVMC